MNNKPNKLKFELLRDRVVDTWRQYNKILQSYSSNQPAHISEFKSNMDKHLTELTRELGSFPSTVKQNMFDGYIDKNELVEMYEQYRYGKTDSTITYRATNKKA